MSTRLNGIHELAANSSIHDSIHLDERYAFRDCCDLPRAKAAGDLGELKRKCSLHPSLHTIMTLVCVECP